MDKKEIYDLLTELGVEYEVTEHKAVYNMDELAEVDLPYPDADAKNLFVRDDKKRNYYMITVRGDKRVDLKEFRREHELRPLSFASADDLMSILKIAPGYVGPFGLLNDEEHRVKLYLDESFNGGLIGVHPNDNTATVWLDTAEMVRVLRNHGCDVEIVGI